MFSKLELESTQNHWDLSTNNYILHFAVLQIQILKKLIDSFLPQVLCF